MEFTSNLWIITEESDRISEEHKKELFAVLTELQALEIDQIENGPNVKMMWHNLNVQGKMIKLGDKFENLYIKYGGYTGMLNEVKRIELERKKEELKLLLPKMPASLKNRFKVKK